MELQSLPIKGYKPQSTELCNLVNEFKVFEEKVLRELDKLDNRLNIDKRWLAIGRTHLEQAFMAINRSLFKPDRVKLED